MLSAAILAGGQATRFGGLDKGALRVEGRSIRERQLAELAALGAGALDVMIVGGPPVESAACRWVPDRVPGLGPLGGVHTALLEASGDPVIVLACDMPYVSAPLLGHLYALARGFDVVVPRTARGYHPLCAVYARACVEPIARRLTAGRLKMAGLFDDVRVREIEADALRAFGDIDRLLANVNSPADHEDLVAHERARSSQGHQR